jgi:hypothetical protein
MREKTMADLTKNTTIRWLTFNRVLILILLLVAFFGYMDAVNLQGVFALDTAYQAENGWSPENNVWSIYWEQLQPMFYRLWLGVLAVIALIWYTVTKDKSESLALFLAPAILITFGTQDLIYFLFSPQQMSAISCWADALIPVSIISNWLGEECPTRFSFFISAGIGALIAWFALYRLKYYEPRRKKK